MKKWVKLVLVIIWLVVIFVFSSQDSTKSTNTSDGLLVRIVETIKRDKLDQKQKDNIISKYTVVIRKSAHFIAYFILGILIYLLLCEYFDNKFNIVLYTVILCCLYAISDEIHQYFVPGRACRILDILIDTSGSFISSIILVIIGKLRNKLIKHN